MSQPNPTGSEMYKSAVEKFKGLFEAPKKAPKISAQITYIVSNGAYFWRIDFPSLGCQMSSDRSFPSKPLAFENLENTARTLGLPYTIK